MKDYLKKAWGILLSTALVLAALFNPHLAYAADVQVSGIIDPVTARSDGTPIAPDEIQEYRIYYAIGEAVTKASPFAVVVSGTEGSISLDLAPGVDTYTLNVGTSAVDTAGRESDALTLVSQTFQVKSTAPPNAPGIRLEIRCGDGCEIVGHIVLPPIMGVS